MKQNGQSDAERTRVVRRVTWVGLVTNIALAAIKFVAGALGGSQALMADGVHSLTDCVTDVAVLVGAEFWSKPPDSSHPFGHRRLETLIAVLVGAVLFVAGARIGWVALSTLRGVVHRTPGPVGLLAAVVSIGAKELLFRWTYREGRRVRSMAMQANAWHHRTDAMSSVVTALAVGGAMLLPDWALLDQIGAGVVSVFVLQAALRIVWPALKELADSSAPKRSREKIVRIAEATEGVAGVHALRTRSVGADLQVDLHVLVDGDLSVRQGHDIAEEVTRRIVEQGPHVAHVVVHTEPA